MKMLVGLVPCGVSEGESETVKYSCNDAKNNH